MFSKKDLLEDAMSSGHDPVPVDEDSSAPMTNLSSLRMIQSERYLREEREREMKDRSTWTGLIKTSGWIVSLASKIWYEEVCKKKRKKFVRRRRRDVNEPAKAIHQAWNCFHPRSVRSMENHCCTCYDHILQRCSLANVCEWNNNKMMRGENQMELQER